MLVGLLASIKKGERGTWNHDMTQRIFSILWRCRLACRHFISCPWPHIETLYINERMKPKALREGGVAVIKSKVQQSNHAS